MSKAIKFGTLGICPVCEGEFKVRNGTLVHHGFQRPGDGMIHGDCFAVGYEPYERSTKGCEAYKAQCLYALGLDEKALADIPNRTVFKSSRRGHYGEPNIVTTVFAVGVTNLYDLERHVKSFQWELEMQIKRVKGEIARMDKLIAAWTLKDLRIVTEEAATAELKAARDARKAERDAKNAAKAEKAAALQAKRDARTEAQKAAIAKFLTDAQAVKGDKAAIDELVYNLFNTKAKKAHGLISYYDWRPFEDTLIDLGLATKDASGWVRLDNRFNH